MMKASSFVAAIALLSVAHLACNPDCESISNLKVSTPKIYDDYEILLTGNPLNALENRRVFFGDVPVKKEDTRFIPNVGLIVRVPKGIDHGYMQLRIEDPDCLDVYVLDSLFEVVEDGYFNALGTYSPPIPPEIVIPNIPISFPSNVDNAWLSPEDPGYCLWFIMYKEKKVVNGDTMLIRTKFINPDSSFEQATCWCLRDYATSHLPYAMNRMSGIIEYDSVNMTSWIDVYIDRTPIGGELEEYTGQFLDINKTKYADKRGFVDCPDTCASTPQDLFDPPTTGHMMILTSKKTGKQLMAFQLD